MCTLDSILILLIYPPMYVCILLCIYSFKTCRILCQIMDYVYKCQCVRIRNFSVSKIVFEGRQCCTV